MAGKKKRLVLCSYTKAAGDPYTLGKTRWVDPATGNVYADQDGRREVNRGFALVDGLFTRADGATLTPDVPCSRSQ